MSTTLIETHRTNAEVYTDPKLCKEKSTQLLSDLHLPLGLLPLSDLEEVGYNRESGFVWMRQKKSVTHTFKKIGKQVSYAQEVTAFVEDKKMKKLTGVKSKELLIWITLSDFFIDRNDPEKIIFKTPGLSRTYQTAAFETEE